MATIIFDADGVLYDSVKRMYDVTNKSLAEFGLEPITFYKFRCEYNSTNWHLMFKKFGLNECDFDVYYETFKFYEAQAPLPNLIPQKVLFSFLKNRRNHNLYVLTSAKLNDIEGLLARDGIREHFNDVISVPSGCKSDELLKIVSNNKGPRYFVGDSTSDAKAVIALRGRGIDCGIKFYGILHKTVHLGHATDMHMSFRWQFEELIQPDLGDALINSLVELTKI